MKLAFYMVSLFLICSSVHAEWNIQDSGTTADLTDVCFIDEYHGWVIGKETTIIATDDGGITWQQQNSPGDYNLNKVFFINEEVGFILCTGDSSYILSTTDGGLTWGISYSAPHDYYFADVFFIDENNGWAVAGIWGIWGSDEGGVIIATTDGGITWETQLNNTSQPTSQPTSPDYFDAIVFSDTSHGWALGTAHHPTFHPPTNVYYTQNGGETWDIVSQLPSDRQAAKLKIVGPDTLWTADHNLNISHDGGQTWSSFSGWGILDVCVDAGSKGWLLERDFNRKIMIIRYTDDGGEQWNEQYIEQYVLESQLNGIDSVGGEFACAVGNSGLIVTFHDDSTPVSTSPHHELIEIEQNYPNPFNSHTTIPFSLAESSEITVSLYSIAGQLVQTICDDYFLSGSHDILINNSSLSSGIYIINFHADSINKNILITYIK